MSASISPTRAPLAASATARFTATVDLPTPPFPRRHGDDLAEIRIVLRRRRRGPRRRGRRLIHHGQRASSALRVLRRRRSLHVELHIGHALHLFDRLPHLLRAARDRPARRAAA